MHGCDRQRRLNLNKKHDALGRVEHPNLPDISKEVRRGQSEGDDDEDDPLKIEPGECHQEEHHPQSGC